MRFFRPLCLLLSLTVLISIFVVPSSAATNLVNPDFSQWENTTSVTSDSGGYKMRVLKIDDGALYLLQSTYLADVNGNRFYMSFSIDTVVLKAGNSYTFSMHIPSFEEIRAKSTYTLTDSQLLANLGDSWDISFCTRDASNTIIDSINFLTITKENYENLQGTDYVFSFECPDYSGSNPIIVISASNAFSNNWLFLDGSMMLVDNNEEDEDGLLAKIFEWFEKQFNAIGESFREITTNLHNGFNTLGDRISNFFINLGSSITNGLNSLLDGIGGWFQKFANVILYLKWTDEPPENPFKMEDGPLASVRGFFDDIVDYFADIEDDFETVIDSITGPVYLLDKFTERFEWLLGILGFTLLMIVISRFIGL